MWQLGSWVLVATSCVEAGVDFSFRTAFRESCGLINLLQIAGRARRVEEYEGAEVWDFRRNESGGRGRCGGYGLGEAAAAVATFMRA